MKHTPVGIASSTTNTLDAGAGSQPSVQYSIAYVLDVLKDSVLKFDDLLGLLPSDSLVKDMKEHIFNGLDEYKRKTEDLKQQLKE